MPISPQPPLAAASQPGIRYPFEYFAAQIAFASRIAAITGVPFLEALSKDTDVRSEITEAAFRQAPNEHKGKRAIDQIGSRAPEEIAQIVYAIYLEQPHAVFDPQWAPPDTMRFGALGVEHVGLQPRAKPGQAPLPANQEWWERPRLRPAASVAGRHAAAAGVRESDPSRN